MTMSGQTFFPGHEDIDKSHSGSADGSHCAKCKMDLRGRGDLRIAADDQEPWKTLRRKNQLQDRMKRETNQMTQANLLRALKQLYPGGPSSVPDMTAAIDSAEEKLKGHLVVDDAYEGQMGGYAQMNAGMPQGISIPFDGRLGGNSTQDLVRRQQMMREQVMEQKLAEAERQMARGIAQKMGALTPERREAARQSAQKALAISLFHTEPRVHAHLLMDAANDVPETMDIALVTAWRTDLNGWRTQATERAEKMIAIMDGLGKTS